MKERDNNIFTGEDPGFPDRGGALKKNAPSGGRRENFGSNFRGVREIVGSSPDWVKPKTIKLVFVASPLSTQH